MSAPALELKQVRCTFVAKDDPGPLVSSLSKAAGSFPGNRGIQEESDLKC